MAHNLNFKDGKASFFTVKEKAWHGLGTVLDKCPTSAEAIKIAQLDYEVQKHSNCKGDGTPIEGSYYTQREDTGVIIGNHVGKNFTIVQNIEAFTFFDDIVGNDMAIYETAGALGKGETIFITAKLPDYITVGKDDIGKYLLLTNSHDGNGTLQIMFTPIRVVCSNTLAAALKGVDTRVKIKHTADVKEKLSKAKEALAISDRLSKELESIFLSMIKTKMKDDITFKYFENILLKDSINDKEKQNKLNSKSFKNVLEKLKNYYFKGPGQPEYVGTLYGAYNAITGYYSNVKKFKDGGNKLEFNYFGDGAKSIQKAFDIAKTNLN